MAANLNQIDFRALANDFKGLDAKDPAGWPVAPRIVLLVVVLLAVVAAGWWFDWKGQLESLEQKQAQEQSLRNDWLNKKRQAVNLDEHRKQLAEIDRAFGSLLKQLPNKSEMESLLVDINQAGLGRGLQFELFKPGSEASKDFYAALPISIRVTGGYHDLGNFAGDLAKLSRIVTLGQMAIDAGAGGSTLKMDAVATTYRYLDEEEMMAKRKAQAANRRGKR